MRKGVIAAVMVGLGVPAACLIAQPAPPPGGSPGQGGARSAVTGTTNPAEVRAGTYKFEPTHSRMTWAISHHGFSHFLGLFPLIEGTLTIDPKNPAASRVEATIPVGKVLTGLDEFDGRLRSTIFQTDKFPTATFRSTAVRMKTPTTAAVTGDLSFMGQTKPITIDIRFNKAGDMGGRSIVGFDGTAVMRRSEWGMAFGLPSIGDEVTLTIEAEFNPA